jgi:hypothetical protein
MERSLRNRSIRHRWPATTAAATSYTYQDASGSQCGNLTSKAGVGNYTYGVPQAADCPEGALLKANAVVQAGSNPQVFYCYDESGNLRRRKVGTTSTTSCRSRAIRSR